MAPPSSHTSIPAIDRPVDATARPPDLQDKAVRGGAFKVAAKWTQALIGVGSAMVLARLLTPADFGLVAMVVSLIALTQSVNNFGLPMAAVHREGVTYGELSTLFWLNLNLSLGIGLFLCAMAPVLVWFYGEPALLHMTFVMALGVVGLSLASQHGALLTRQMRFGVLALIDVVSLVVGVATGIIAAVYGLGYWALVLLTVAMQLTQGVGTWWAAGWRPARRRTLRNHSREGVRAMLNYGAGYSGAKILNHLSRNIDRVLVGFFHGPAAVGLYDNAYRWSLFPIEQLYKPLKTVAVSGLSRVQNRPETFRAYFRSALRLVLTLCMPVIAFIFVETRDVVLFLLGDQWLAAVPILRVLCLNAFIRTVSKVTPWLYLSQGETGRQFRWSLLHAPVLILAVALGVQWGPLGVAIGFTAATALLTYPEIVYCLRVSHFTGRDLWRALWRPLVASVGAALAAFAFTPSVLGDAGLVGDVLVEGVVFGAAYALVWVGLPGGWTALRNLIRLAAALRRKTDDPVPAAPSSAPASRPESVPPAESDTPTL